MVIGMVADVPKRDRGEGDGGKLVDERLSPKVSSFGLNISDLQERRAEEVSRGGGVEGEGLYLQNRQVKSKEYLRC